MKLFTIGVYGSTEESFFQSLVDNKIDAFCDIRQRRGVRGSQYAYVNSNYLQARLEELGIKYVYEKALAPTNEIRQKQKDDDKRTGMDKKHRTELGLVFKSEYTKNILDVFDIDELNHRLVSLGANNIVFFCVEQFPKACHSSLVTARMSRLYNYEVNHL